ncbi:hypothetical protein OHT57_46970 [Streptomyces sp. NBC_00285]|uniref:hypothetical protein n=1 Tax=Streptomyces sp. NBC_00285 TaxID=2975700 RepID=UPI002E2C73DC|nr:hypothetical protein [Streptomyces sp. NBC_00285]
MTVDATAIRDLKDRLSFERHAQIRSLREVAASVIAAAGQVRDVRLDQLENPDIAESDTLRDILFDVLIELTLGPLASAATSMITKRVTSRFLKPLLGKQSDNSSRIVTIPTIVVPYPLGYAVAAVESRVPDYETNPGLWREVWTSLTLGFASSAVSVGKGLAERAVTPSPANTFVPSAADSPASTVEEAVLRRCAVLEHVVGRTFDSYERDLDDQGLTAEKASELKKFLAELAATPRISGNEARVLRLFFEKCIWCIALPSIAKANRETLYQRAGEDEVEITSIPVRELTISEDLASYLVRRLPHPRGDGLQTFAAHVPAGFERIESLGRGFKSDLPWRAKGGGELKLPYFVPSGAYTELTDHFSRMHGEMETLGKKLAAVTPKAISTASDPMRQAARIYGPPAP